MNKRKRDRRRNRQQTQRRLDAKRHMKRHDPERATVDRGTKELRAHRFHASFDEASPMSYDPTSSTTFPLALMKSRGLIDIELHDAGMRFGALGWALFGEPFAGCEALYQRMVGGGGDGPRVELDPHKAEERRAERRALYEAMTATLQRRDPLLGEPIESGRMRRVVLDVCRYTHSPRWFIALVAGERYRINDAVDRQLLMDGLGRLAELERRRIARRAA